MTSATKTPKSVRWALNCGIVFIPRIESLSSNARKRIWLSSEERDRIREEYYAAVSCMKMGLPETDDLCYTGLEYKLAKLGRKRRLARQVAKAAVLEEFDHQTRSGDLNPEVIREIYEIFVYQSKAEALQRAQEDYIATTTKTRRRSSSNDLPAPSDAAISRGSSVHSELWGTMKLGGTAMQPRSRQGVEKSSQASNNPLSRRSAMVPYPPRCLEDEIRLKY